MKTLINNLNYITVIGLILITSTSCDRDFTNIESDIQGIKNFEATSKLFPFVAKTQTFTPFNTNGATDAIGIQTNALNGSLFGIYKNPTAAFGTTIASVITQVTPRTFNPNFGDEEREIESLFLTIPYFSSRESTDTYGNNSYKLDSVFGNTNQEFKLSIYRSNYVLRDLDPNSNFQNPQSYFSNQSDVFESNLTSADLLYVNENFKISAEENRVPELDDMGQPVFEADGTTPSYSERYPPGIRINLVDLDDPASVAYWENIFFTNQESGVFSTQSNFKDFFRGLIIKVEALPATPNNGSITYLNFNGANILFDYTNKEEKDAIAAGETIDVRNTTIYRLEFNGNRVNTFNTIDVEDFDGEENNLYLKGTEGSMATLDLFSGDIENEEGDLVPALDFFISKKDKWLINEANLVFYVNQDIVMGDEPNRVTLYDLKNNTPIIDYFLDGSTNNTRPTLSKNGFSEVLKRDNDGNGIKYKIRLTGHITNILQADSTNVKLGLFLANNINVLSQSRIQGKNSDDDDTTLETVPSTSVLSTRATVLHGANENVNPELRAEFEIFYTEPEN